MQWIENLPNKNNFNRTDILHALGTNGIVFSTPSFKKNLQKMLLDGEIARVGRNSYCIPEKGKGTYFYRYSDLANSVAGIIKSTYPMLDFSISELIQLNEFVNHQIAHNVIFLYVENDTAAFVFDTLKEHFPGKVLLRPSVETFNLYRYDNTIVIGKRVTEAPPGKREPWHARIEKLLVDTVKEPLWKACVEESEFTTIYEEVFSKYIIDESCLFRYARRRTAEKEIKDFINEKTNIKLKTEREKK